MESGWNPGLLVPAHPSHTALLQMALSSRGQWWVPLPDHAGGGDPPALPHRWSRIIWVGSAFIAHTFDTYLHASGALCSAPKMEVTLGKVDLKTGKVDSLG